MPCSSFFFTPLPLAEPLLRTKLNQTTNDTGAVACAGDGLQARQVHEEVLREGLEGQPGGHVLRRPGQPREERAHRRGGAGAERVVPQLLPETDGYPGAGGGHPKHPGERDGAQELFGVGKGDPKGTHGAGMGGTIKRRL